MTKKSIDILQMELDGNLPNWLSKDRDQIRKRNRALYWAKKEEEARNAEGAGDAVKGGTSGVE